MSLATRREYLSPNWCHNRQFFYKYVTAKVAKIVLTTRKLRWSSPLLFNDPFDVTQDLRLNFDEAKHRPIISNDVDLSIDDRIARVPTDWQTEICRDDVIARPFEMFERQGFATLAKFEVLSARR